jgi:hypothetical protein
MSKQNKVNKSNYDQAGRLTPDEMAREREKQSAGAKAPARERNSRPAATGEGITGRATSRTARESAASSRHRNEREG